MKQKEIGYHAFNLYALAMIKARNPDSLACLDNKVASVMAYIRSREFMNGLHSNQFGYPYNPCGFEVAYALQVFPVDANMAVKLCRLGNIGQGKYIQH